MTNKLFEIMKILIIGGTGVLSSAVTIEAIKKGIHVTMINRGNQLKKIPNEVTLITADKNNTDYIDEQLKDKYYDAIIDFLCYSKKDLEKSFNLYSKYTLQYFFISSCAVYNVTDSRPYDENSPKGDNDWYYSINKYECEILLKELAQKCDTNYTIIRPAITYGDTRIPYGIAPKYGYHWTLPARILAGKPIIRWNKGENKKNMMRVEDFATALIGLIGNIKALNECFNICSDNIYSFNDVIKIIEEYLGREAIFFDLTPEEYAEAIPYRKGEILSDRSKSSCFDNRKIKDVLPEWHQSFSLKEGIFKTLNAYVNNEYQNGIDYYFDGECDRIVSKYCKIRGFPKDKFITSFIDYLNKGNVLDKNIYYNSYNINCFSRKIMRFSKRILKKILFQ